MTEPQGPRQRFLALLVWGALGLAALAYWALPQVLPAWNGRLTDQLFVWRNWSPALRPSIDSNLIIHVDLTDKFFALTGRHYVNRRDFAQVVQNLQAMQVAVQVWDYVLCAPAEPASDQALVDAVAGKAVYFGSALAPAGLPGKMPQDPAYRRVLGNSRWAIQVQGGQQRLDQIGGGRPTFPALADAATGMGFLNALADADGVYRRLPLLLAQGDSYYPSLALRVAADFLQVDPDGIILRRGQIVLGGARFADGRVKDLVIPIDGQGRLMLNFLGDWSALERVDMGRVLQASQERVLQEVLTDMLAGRIALVGDMSTDGGDLGPVPTDGHYPLSGLHATALHNILSGQFMRQASWWATWTAELALGGLVLVLALRAGPLGFVLGSMGLALGYVGLVAGAFLFAATLFNLLRPLAGLGLATLAVVGYRFILEERAKWLLRNSFATYFPAALVERLVERPQAITVGGQKKELSILFSDIVNFSGHTATMDPDRVQTLLNEYFAAMTRIAFAQGGTVDKFIGDGLMVFFGDPDPQPDHAERAARTALAMQREAAAIDALWRAKGVMPLQLRIGVNTGQVTVGNMGSPQRLAYTVLGAPVNVAKRLESHAPAGGILVAAATTAKLGGAFVLGEAASVQAKGFPEPIPVFLLEKEG
ncbi:MAG: CHASE2 domain-containing protein [Candidatus Latescibacteria bacterium]|nr:CHASE2 domain-containing protein [Candidatus Latescibacterota bacterium]